MPNIQDDQNLRALKKLARTQAKGIRVELYGQATHHWHESISHSVLKIVDKEKVKGPIGGFLPIGTEVDLRFVLADLGRRGYCIALPKVIKAEYPLEFRCWEEGDPLEEGGYGTLAPLKDASKVNPKILLVPLLAFDKEGYRLGYGGGYYDRTIDHLRKKGGVTTIGVAYSGQLVVKVPKGDFDQALDMVVTEKGVWVPKFQNFRKRAF
ncbi:MAG: 5-formyltetrahydrofolate cyclo-ligase [Sphingomonadales bacterium]